MRISSATLLLYQDARGRWPWDRWRWFRGCGCSSCVVRVPIPKMKETTFLRLGRRRARNLARNSLDLAAKVAGDVSSLGFPSFRSAARAAHGKNSDSPIRLFFSVSHLTNRASKHAHSVAPWLRSLRNNDNQRRSGAATLRRDLLCGSPDCSACARAMPKTSSPLPRLHSGTKRLPAPLRFLPPLRTPSAAPTIRTARGSIPITAAPFSERHGIASIDDAAGQAPIDGSLTVSAPPRSLIPRRAWTSRPAVEGWNSWPTQGWDE